MVQNDEKTLKNKRNPRYERSAWWKERGVRKKLSQKATNTTRERMIREASWRGNSILAWSTNTTWHHTVGWTVQQFLNLINHPTYKSTTPDAIVLHNTHKKFSQIFTAHPSILWRSPLSFSRYFQILFFSLDLFCLSMTSR